MLAGVSITVSEVTARARTSRTAKAFVLSPGCGRSASADPRSLAALNRVGSLRCGACWVRSVTHLKFTAAN